MRRITEVGALTLVVVGLSIPVVIDWREGTLARLQQCQQQIPPPVTNTSSRRAPTCCGVDWASRASPSLKWKAHWVPPGAVTPMNCRGRAQGSAEMPAARLVVFLFAEDRHWRRTQSGVLDAEWRDAPRPLLDIDGVTRSDQEGHPKRVRR